MSLDVMHGSGVLFEAEELMIMLFPADKKAITKAVAALSSAVSRCGSNEFPPFYGDVAKKLETVIDKTSLIAWFIGVLRTNIGDSTWYRDEQSLELFWHVTVRALGLKGLPPVIFEYFRRNREADDDVPLEVPCIAFIADDLFVTKLSAKGRKLARALGLKMIESTSWTDLSY